MTRRLAVFVVVVIMVVAGVDPAGAQDAEEARDVEISFDIGDFDGERGDWPITVVQITGDVEEGTPFTVELTADDGSVVWSGTEEFRAPITTIAVDRFVAVGEVAGAGLSQVVPEVAGEVAQRPKAEVLSQGAGGGGSGQLAFSMVLAVVLVAIVFRTPLPSQTSQRWTK